MYAIIETGGKQYRVSEGDVVVIEKLNANEGDTVEFDKVLLVDNEGNVTVGAPTVNGAKVVAEVVNPLVKGDKVIVFKKKRRKGYQKKNGHRQSFTRIKIDSITA